MHRMLYELATSYAEATGCSCSMDGDRRHAVLAVEGLHVHIGLLERADMLLFQTVVALLPPPGAPGREEFCLHLLSANNLFRDTGGFTLGVDEGQNLVTLQIAWELQHLDAEGFTHLVNNLLSAAMTWMIRLDAWCPSSSEGRGAGSEEVDSMMMNGLKV